MNPTTILILVAVILVALILGGWLFISWMNKQKEEKAKGELTSSDVKQSDVDAKNAVAKGYDPKKHKRITLTPSQIVSIGANIENAIHTFSSDDTVTILSEIRKAITRTDFVLIKEHLMESRSINILDVLSKDLTPKALTDFTNWMKNLKDWVAK